MVYEFKELRAGPCWLVHKAGLPRLSAGEAFARDWLAERGYAIVLLEHDTENDAIDVMTSKGRLLYQFAIEPEERATA